MELIAYLLFVSHHDSTVLSKLWTDVSMYRDTLAKPPWFSLGLKPYLLATNRKGIADALTWIREY
jgi:hypothetical protein